MRESSDIVIFYRRLHLHQSLDGACSWAPLDVACSWAPLDGACSKAPLVWACIWNVTSVSVAFRTLFLHPLGALSLPDSLRSSVQYTPLCRRLQIHCEAQSSTLLNVVASRLTAKLSPVQYTPLCWRLQTHCEAQSSPVHSSMSSPPD